MKARILASLVAGVLVLPMSSHATNHHHSGHAASPTAAATAALVDGVVKKVDKSAAKVTLAHGPLTNLNMPAMTMSFAVKDAGWLKSLKEGGKVRFVADRIDGTFTIVRLEAAAP